jgi:penicillin V acylase-like amidase (Ntn superfamily)
MNPSQIKFIILLTMLCGIFFSLPSNACTRVVYKGPENTVITARSMDFSIPIPANLWIMPRGMKRSGQAGPASLTWSSKYGSIATSSWDIATSDGMNEKGLNANLLWLVESEYPEYNPAGNKPGLAISLWAQYVLDNFATVAEAVNELSKELFTVVTDFIPGTDKFTTVHMSLSDPTGDNAILEYVGGRLIIHHSPDYTVMTNSPPFEQQLAVRGYWEQIPGSIMLPGTNRASDRFVRADYYINAIPQTDNTRVAVASVLSVIRNCSVPFGISTPDKPDVSSTQWRIMADHKNLTYYFETVLTPNTFWVDLKKLDFSASAPVKKLSVSNNETYNGETSDLFVVSEPFEFMGI